MKLLRHDKAIIVQIRFAKHALLLDKKYRYKRICIYLYYIVNNHGDTFVALYTYN